MSATMPGRMGGWDPLMSDVARSSDEAFDAAVRARAADPVVRRVMATLRERFDGDGYTEDEEGFRWLVVDASRVVAGVESGRDLNPDFAPDDRGHILDALCDTARWSSEDDPPEAILDALEAAVSGSREGAP